MSAKLQSTDKLMEMVEVDSICPLSLSKGSKLVKVFCSNEVYPARGQVRKGNIKVHSRKERRYRCTVCGKTFSERKGTMFYWKKHFMELIRVVVTLSAYGCPVQALVAAFGLKAETVRRWAAEAGVHCEQVYRHLVLGARLPLLHVQADEIRARIQAGVVWMAMAIMVKSRLWLGDVVSAHRDKALIRQPADMVRTCALPEPLLLVVDGLAAYVNAFRRAFRSKEPRPEKRRKRLVPWPDVVIGQVVKYYKRRRVVRVVRRLVQETEEALSQLLQASEGGQTLNYGVHRAAQCHLPLPPRQPVTAPPLRRSPPTHAAFGDVFGWDRVQLLYAS